MFIKEGNYRHSVRKLANNNTYIAGYTAKTKCLPH